MAYFSPPPRILVNLTGADAGQAIYEDNLLRFNREFFRHNRADFIKNIVAHESAHLVAARVYGPQIAAHGREWKEVMSTVFQVAPSPHHHYDLRQIRFYRFIYGCRCQRREIPLSAIRHNRQQRGTVYLCAECDCRLRFLYEQTGYGVSVAKVGLQGHFHPGKVCLNLSHQPMAGTAWFA